MLKKVCGSCKAEKLLSEFYPANWSRGLRPSRGGMGVSGQCKICIAEKRKPGITAAREKAARLADAGMKECTKCGAIKSTEGFHLNSAAKEGRAHRCPDCVNANGRKWREANPDAFRRWRTENEERRVRYCREWREANTEHLTQSYAAWAKANPDKINALVAKRNAAKKNALAPWANLDAIRAIYAEAARLTRETGGRHEVDHIYPLQGETVCGLHVETNLQILTKTENIRKKNRMPEEYEAMLRDRLAA